MQSMPITFLVAGLIPNVERCMYSVMLCDKVCQCPATGQWFSPVLCSKPFKLTDRQVIAEILLNEVTKNPDCYHGQFTDKLPPSNCM
jgi:hypothetical protein